MREQYEQLQKEMQQTSRSLATTQPDTAKKLRDSMGKSQQEEVQSRMEWTEAALRQGMGQYAVMRESPVTQSLNELKDDLKQLEASAANQGQGGEKGQAGMQQALDQAERVRREIEQLGRAAQGQQQARNGQGQGNQSGRQGQQQARNGQPGQGQQPGNGQQQGQGQPGQGQQQGQQGQGQGQGQQAGNSPQGGPGNQGGGGFNGTNYGASPNGGYTNGGPAWNGGQLRGDPWQGDPRRIDGANSGDPQSTPTPAQAEAAYADLLRDLQRLRGSVADDKDAAREYGQLVRQAQELDPKRWASNPQLAEVINGQILQAVDQIELVLRRKIDASDSSVRSANPRNTPPGYADAVAEYYKRLSK
jgi:hypothetical protein